MTVMMSVMMVAMVIMVLGNLAEACKILDLSHTMKKYRTDNVQGEPGTADNEHQFWILDFYKEKALA